MGLFSFFNKSKQQNKSLEPESKWIVKIDGATIKTTDNKGQEQLLKMTDIQQIIVETNDSGPWETDVWWRILSDNGLVSIPQGATGESEMLQTFQNFSDFDNETFIKAMTSTNNAEFVVWKKNNVAQQRL